MQRQQSSSQRSHYDSTHRLRCRFGSVSCWSGFSLFQWLQCMSLNFDSLRHDSNQHHHTTLDQLGQRNGTNASFFHLSKALFLIRSPVQVSGSHIHYTYGLHRRCSSLTHSCVHFPQNDECHREERSFCSMWRSVGVLMSFAVVIEGMTLIAFIVVLGGGKQKREAGWKVLSGLLLLVGLIQCAGMALMVDIYELLSEVDRYAEGSTGISLRQRRPILPGLEAGHLVDSLHRQLEHERSVGGRPFCICAATPIRRGIRAYTRRALSSIQISFCGIFRLTFLWRTHIRWTLYSLGSFFPRIRDNPRFGHRREAKIHCKCDTTARS